MQVALTTSSYRLRRERCAKPLKPAGWHFEKGRVSSRHEPAFRACRALRRPLRSAPTSGGIAMDENPKSMSWWEATKITALLIGIAIVSANLTGFWQASAPTPESEARAQARAQQRV
jgi:hypothetical protein